ncbi:MAG: delta-aminolevulinic acid dehydratase [Halieaceae bacterium]|nr:delta-aminolevulinic acid dehydratase [Halieaceae bacterium]
MAARGWLIALLLFSQQLRAECGCLWQGAFADVQGATDLVVAGRVVASSGNSIDLSVTRNLRGELFRDTVRVWLDTGDLCRAEVGSFPLESTWVMALDRIDEVPPGGFDPGTPNLSFGREGDFSLSRCGGYWLKLAENMVTGNLTNGPRWEMDPKMSPILLELVAGYVGGDIDRDTLEEAGRVDPALQELIINTRLFLRQGQ